VPRAPSLIMTVRTHTKPADTRLREFVLVNQLVALSDERHPDYHERWTRAEHVYALLCKLSLANGVLFARDVNILIDYVIPEWEVPFAMPKFLSAREPVLVQIYGRMHVVFRGKLVLCTCTEHALAVWSLIIINKLGGTFMHKNITEQLKMFLTMPEAASGMDSIAGVVVDD